MTGLTVNSYHPAAAWEVELGTTQGARPLFIHIVELSGHPTRYLLAILGHTPAIIAAPDVITTSHLPSSLTRTDAAMVLALLHSILGLRVRMPAGFDQLTGKQVRLREVSPPLG